MEQRLVEQAMAGDLDAYDQLVERFQGVAFRVAWLTLGNVSEAEDVVQDAFVKAFLNLDTFDVRSSFRPWMLRIVSNEARNRRRSIRRHSRLQLQFKEPGETTQHPDLPEEVAMAAETRDEIIQELNKLSEQDRTLLVYRYFLDLEPVEIAEILDRPASTVRTQVSRALSRLKDKLNEKFVQAPAETTELNGDG